MEITANNLTFRTIKKTVVNGASFSLRTEEKTALFGHEGSGKKAALLMLGGFLKPTSGSIRCNGRNISKNLDEYRKKIGLGEIENINPLSDSLTLQENLRFCIEMKGVKRAEKDEEETFEHFGIGAYADTPAIECNPLVCALASLACACAGDPDIIILDEPTKKLTSLQAQAFWKKLNENIGKKTLIFSTKNLEEAKANADNIINMESTAKSKLCLDEYPAIPSPAKISADGSQLEEINNPAI